MIDRNRSIESRTGTSLGREVLDRIGGTLKEATGALVHDRSLREEGELQRRRAGAARVARAETFKATRRSEQAQVRVHGAERAAQRVRRMADEEAEADHERIERRRQLDEARRTEAAALAARRRAATLTPRRR
jgi:hypothetical protein